MKIETEEAKFTEGGEKQTPHPLFAFVVCVRIFAVQLQIVNM